MQRCRSKLEKILFKTLEDRQNSCRKRKDLDQDAVAFRLLGCALTEEQPDAKNKQAYCAKKRKRNMTVIFSLHQNQIVNQNAH